MQSNNDYCGSPSLLTPLGASYYARSKSLCPRHYQVLMDRGWRRSGTLLYLPDAIRSCCPHYTIRLPASRFKPSRDQRQALNRWNRFVLGEAYEKEVAKKHPRTKQDKKRANNTFDLRSTIRESEKAHTKPDIKPEHDFVVTLEPDTLTDEKFRLFDNYQRNVHHEGDSDITQVGFKRFLCSSPLHRHQDLRGKRLGSFHHCYRLDGRLIAMSVLDLLPHAVSGVYFIYHSDFEKWSFGKLSALREAALALEEGYEYYYMGYYIHGCKKMRYKGDYKPQYVLDYYSLQWDELDDELRALMDRTKYASMSRERRRQAAVTENIQSNGGLKEDCLSHPSDSDEDEDLNGAKADKVLYPVPVDAVSAGLSLLDLGMPGVLSPAELRSEVDLDVMRISLGRQGIHEMQDLVSWHTGSERDPTSIKGIMAEMAAAAGPVIAKQVIVDLGR